MSSRDRREYHDPFEALMRRSLEEAGRQAPRANLRHAILQRAGRQQRRQTAWRLPPVALDLLKLDHTRFANPVAATQMLYVQALFGPRLGLFSANLLMR